MNNKYDVPDGYALISIDALKAWGKYDEVRNACQFPADQAEQEPVVRFCPGCGSVGEVDTKYIDCCPDGNKARRIPKDLAEHCSGLFDLAIGNTAPHQQSMQEPVAWKHDCAALCANDVELWIDNCPHCGKPRTAAPVRTKDLTDDEIAQAVGSPLDEVYLADFRAVIAADREKNK